VNKFSGKRSHVYVLRRLQYMVTSVKLFPAEFRVLSKINIIVGGFFIGYNTVSQPFFLGGTLKIGFHIPRNPIPMKTHIGQANW
jgi:hypothetical protein